MARTRIWDEDNGVWQDVGGKSAADGVEYHVVDPVAPVAPRDGTLWTNPDEDLTVPLHSHEGEPGHTHPVIARIISTTAWANPGGNNLTIVGSTLAVPVETTHLYSIHAHMQVDFNNPLVVDRYQLEVWNADTATALNRSSITITAEKTSGEFMTFDWTSLWLPGVTGTVNLDIRIGDGYENILQFGAAATVPICFWVEEKGVA